MSCLNCGGNVYDGGGFCEDCREDNHGAFYTILDEALDNLPTTNEEER